MADKFIPLTGDQKNSLYGLVDDPEMSPNFAATGPANPNLKVFAVHFDGTENDASHVPEDEQATLVFESHQHLSALADPNLKSTYIKGVGTDWGSLTNKIAAARGTGCRENAELAYEQLAAQAKAWRAENPNCQIHVHVVGFSRGSATGLHFMNMVDKLGIRGVDPVAFAPGKVKSSAVLFDTVATGQQDLDLTLPNSNLSTLHLTAGGEERPYFKLSSLTDHRRPSEMALARNVEMAGRRLDSSGLLRYKRLREVQIPGARHSDVGGSYQNGRIREVTSYLCNEFQRSLGLPVNGERPTLKDIQAMHANDSRAVKIARESAARQQVERLEAVRKEAPWDGGYTETCVVMAGPNKVQSSNNVRHVSSSPGDWDRGINEQNLGSGFSIEFNLATDAKTGLPKIEAKSSSPGAFTYEGDGLLRLKGFLVRGAPSKAELIEQLHREGVVRVSIGVERAWAPHDGRHPGGTVAPAKDVARDPWPTGIVDAIRHINTAGRTLSAQHVSTLVRECMESAANHLMAYDEDVSSIKITPVLDESGATRFELGCISSSTGRYFNAASLGGGLEEWSLANTILDLEAGLHCVVATLGQERCAQPVLRPLIFGDAPAPVASPGLRSGMLGGGLNVGMQRPEVMERLRQDAAARGDDGFERPRMRLVK